VEQLTTAPATRHELCAFQASTENISIRELSQPRRIVTVCLFCALEILLLTYLLTYLLTCFLQSHQTYVIYSVAKYRKETKELDCAKFCKMKSNGILFFLFSPFTFSSSSPLLSLPFPSQSSPRPLATFICALAEKCALVTMS